MQAESLVTTLAALMTDRGIKGLNTKPTTQEGSDRLAQAIINPGERCLVFDRRKLKRDCGMWLTAKLARRMPKRVREGYLEIIIGKDERDKNVIISAHRFLCWAVNGPPPGGQDTCMHLCFFSRCTNCKHLQWGGKIQNHKKRSMEISKKASLDNLRRKN